MAAERSRATASVESATATLGGPTTTANLDGFDGQTAIKHVRRLARRIGVRVRATRGERRAARYAGATLRSLGYRVRVRRFTVDGGTSRNVTARWPGSKRYPIVLGGHIDSVATSPGANDNASGIAVLLELARLFAGRREARFVKFVAFGSEEYGIDGRHHAGSQVFVNRLGGKGRRRLAGMVSVDMIADGRPLIIGTAGIGPAVVARTLLRKVRKASIKATYRTTCDCSDNGPFERAGIPGAFVWSGSEPDYHSPTDTVANMSRRDLRRTGRAMRAFVKALDLKLLRRFRQS
ncbi:MAG: M28 family metallopeptidase [Actinomycetota bacterium]